MAVLGLDAGTQSLKAIVLDDALAVRGSASRAYPYTQPRAGWAEQDPALWLAALRPAIAEALDAAGLDPRDIAALAISGQLDGCIPVDAQGEALANAIIWMDRRAASFTAGLDGAAIASRSGLVCDATHMAAKIAWSRRNGGAGAVLWHQPVSYLVARLTNARRISHSLASTTMLYGLATHDWDAELLEIFGLAATGLPTLGDECEVAGRLTPQGAELTGLLAGTPVGIGTGDDFASLLGCGVHSPGTVAVSIGTAETVAALSRDAVLDDALLVETHAFPGGFYHLGNPGWLSGGAVRWASGLLGCASDADLSALAEQAPAGSEGLVFLPALTGAMTPRWNAAARGSFLGLTAAHGRSHLARAVLEGCAFAMRDVVDRLAALGVPTDRLRLMGGGAHSDLWCRIRADVSGRPAEILGTSDASALGAALMAAVSAGLAPSLPEASARRRCDLPAVAPDAANGAIYEQAYHAYRAASAALDPYWTAIPER